MAFSYTDSWKLAQPSQDSHLSRMSVRNGLALDKGVCQFELPIYVYHDMRQSRRVHWGPDSVEVELKLFNDRALNRDLKTLCAKVTQERPRLPDGRCLLFRE